MWAQPDGVASVWLINNLIRQDGESTITRQDGDSTITRQDGDSTITRQDGVFTLEGMAEKA